VNFPSQITGFCGSVFFGAADHALGLACVRAWNDWLFEEWYSPHPDAIVPLGITYLADPVLAADEIRRKRRTRVHVGDVPRTAARDRPAVALGS